MQRSRSFILFMKIKTNILSLSFVFSIAVLFPFLIFIKGAGIKPYSVNEIIVWMILFSFLPLVLLSPKNKIYPIYTFSVFLFLFYQIIIFFCSNYHLEGITSILIHDKYIIISFLTPHLIFSMDIERKLLKALVAVNMVVVYILMYKIVQNPSELLSLYGASGFLVKTSVFPNPNMLGVYISTLIFIQFLFAETQKKIMYKNLIFVLMIAPSLFSLVLTFSRRAWLAFLISMGIYFFIKRQNKFIIVMSILFLGILATNIDCETIWHRLLLSFDGSYESNFVRIENLRGTILLLSKSVDCFLGGVGVGVTGPGSIAVYSTNQYPFSIHSYFLQLLIEFGLIGLFLYLFIISVIFFVFWKTYRIYKLYDRHMVNYLTTYMLCYLVLLISSIVGLTPISFPTNLLQWLFVGLIIRHYYIARSLIKSKGITQINKLVDHRFLINLKRNIYEKT